MKFIEREKFIDELRRRGKGGWKGREREHATKRNLASSKVNSCEDAVGIETAFDSILHLYIYATLIYARERDLEGLR